MTTDIQDQPEARRKRQLKWCAFIVAGIIAQTAIIVLFVLLVLRFRNPKVRIAHATAENLNLNTSSSSPYFSLDLNTEITVKNTNFGHFKFENSNATILYKGIDVGEGSIIRARARARSTKKIYVTFSVNSNKAVSNYSELDVLTLNGQARLDGKIVLFKIIKKKKSVEMNCTMEVKTATQEIQNLICQ